MDEARFWAIIRESRSEFDPKLRDGNQERQTERLRELLEALPPEEIVDFARQFDSKLIAAYRWDLCTVARLVEDGYCSDDGFHYFRSWLISLGRTSYEAALRDPDSLVDVVDAPGFECSMFEEFGTVANQVYEELTGDFLPEFDLAYPKKPKGERLDDAGLAKLCPRLWAKCGK